MPAIGPFGYTRLGPELSEFFVAGGSLSTFAMPAVNNAAAVRFKAVDTRDVLAVYINYSAITAAGTVEVRIELIDTATGKPNGTLYDANAIVTITPVSGWNTCTFATPPSTGLVAGNEYAVVILNTGAGTTMTLRAHIAQASAAQIPSILLTANDASTRSNFAETSNSVPVCALQLTGPVEEDWGMIGAPIATTFDVYGTRAFGVKFTVPSGLSVKVVAIAAINYTVTGSPGDIRCQIFDSGGTLVTGATCTILKTSITGTGKRLVFRIPETTLAAGTYSILIDQTNHSTTISNRFLFYSFAFRSSNLVPSNLIFRTTLDITAGPPPTFTDDAASMAGLEILVNDLVGSGGGGSVALPVVRTV